MDISQSIPYMPGDARLVDHIVCELKSQGIFDQFRKDCLADVDTKPAYQNLHQRVEGIVSEFLKHQTWKTDLNKNQLREKLRKHILELNFLDQGVDRIVDQVVNPKVSSIFIPKVEEVVYRYLGIEIPNRPLPSINGGFSNVHQMLPLETNNLLPQDLEAVSPDSVRSHEQDEARTRHFELNIGNKYDSVSKDSIAKTVEEPIQSVSKTMQQEESGIREKYNKISHEHSLIPKASDSDKTNQKKNYNLNNMALSDMSDLTSVDSKNSSVVQESQVEGQKSVLDVDYQVSHVSTSYIVNAKPMETEQTVEEIVEDVCIDESSSETNLKIDMSPLTPVRIYDHIENSSDAQPAFDQSASFINKTGMSFAIEEFKSINSSQDKVSEVNTSLDEPPKEVFDSDNQSAKSISQHRSSVESKNSNDSFKPQNDTDSSESKSSSVFESMIRAKMKIMDDELNILESRFVEKTVENDDSNGTYKENFQSPVSKSYSSPDVNLLSVDIPKFDPKYIDTVKKIDSHRHESSRVEYKEKISSSKEKQKERHSSHKSHHRDNRDSSSRDDERYKIDATKEVRKERHHSSKDTHRDKHESSKVKHKDHHDSLKIVHKDRHTSSSEVEKQDLEKKHKERRDSSKEKSKSQQGSSKEEHRDKRSHKDSKSKDKSEDDCKKSEPKQKHENDSSSKHGKKESSSSGRHHSSSQKSSSKDSRSGHSSKSKHHSSERHSTSLHPEKSKQDNNIKSDKSVDMYKNKDKNRTEHVSSGKHRDNKSDKYKSSSSSVEKDKKRDEKKHKKSTDDHYSSSGRNRIRRSTDRDSNDGNSGFNKGSNSQSDISVADSHKTSDSISKTYSANNSNNSSSPNDCEAQEMIVQESVNSICYGDVNSETQIKKPVRLEEQLNTPFEASIAAIDMIYLPKMKKPKIASNASEALKLMRVRKEIDLEERRRHQTAMKAAEQKKNLPLAVSQIFSGLSGPQVEITCENPVSSVKIEELHENSKPCLKSEEIIHKDKLKTTGNEFNDDLPSDEEDLLYYDEISINGSKVEYEKYSKFVNNAEKQFIKKYEKFVFLKNCSENIVAAIQKVLLRGPRLIINHLCTEGFKPAAISEPSEVVKSKNANFKVNRTKTIAFAPDLEVKNSSADDITDDEKLISSPLSPVDVKSSCSPVDVTSPDYMDKINEQLNKTSKREIMEIILGGADIEYFYKTAINLTNLNNDAGLIDPRKRKLENADEPQGTSFENNNQARKCLNKFRKLDEAEFVSISNVDLTNGRTPHSEDDNSKVSSSAPDVEFPRNKSSRFLGKAKNVGLSKVKSHCSAQSICLLREKSEGNYANENSEILKRRTKRTAKAVIDKDFKIYVSKLPLMQENS